MMKDEQAKLPLDQEVKKEMAYFACSGCNRYLGVQFELTAAGLVRALDRMTEEKVGERDIINAVVIRRSCKERTAIEMRGTDLVFVSDKETFGRLNSEVPKVVHVMHMEAKLCFWGGAYRAVPGMCRSCIEQSLSEKGVKGRDLNEQIENAPQNILGDEEKTLAHGARLTGRNTLHRMREVTRTQALVMISATTDLVNHIVGQKPASQSGPGSNGP